ncbi:MAG: ParB/RepB/Spo0J family partition protein [Planctomycetota bacterium]
MKPWKKKGISGAADGEPVVRLPVGSIRLPAWRDAVRYDPEGIETLKRSIARHGVLVPVIVRRDRRGYELVAGARRLAACRDLHRRTVPAVVRDIPADRVLETGFLENAGRAGLTPLEKVEGFQQYAEEHGTLTEGEMARHLGLGLAEIRENRWMLDLPVLLKEGIHAGMITPDHARILAAVPSREEQVAFIRRTFEEGLTAGALGAAIAEGEGEKK